MRNDGSDTLSSLRQLLSSPPLQRRGVQQAFKVPAVTAGQPFTHTVDGGYWERLIAVTFNFAASATVANRGLQWQQLDGDGSIFNYVQVVPVVTANQSVLGTLDFTLPVGAQSQQSQSAYGSATTPSALTSIATTPTLQPGTYNVGWTVELGGTVAAGTDNDNFGVYSGTTQLERSINEAAANTYPQQSFEIVLPAAGTLILKNIAAGTAGAIYSGELVVTPVDQVFGEGQLPDIVLPAGFGWEIQVLNIQVGDQLTNVNYIVERYASDYANGGMSDETDRWLRRAIREELAGQ